jgi:penicillin-binding protein 1A
MSRVLTRPKETRLREPAPFDFKTPGANEGPRRRWPRRLVLGLLFLLLAVASLFYGFMAAMAQKVENLSAFRVQPKANGVIYASDGHTVLTQLRSDQNRWLVHSDQIAPVMKQATVAIEDRRFYQHGAIDPIGLARAAFNDLTGGSVQGGSTITQQFVKIAYTNGSRSIGRKIVEAALANQVEQKWSKDHILTEYLNIVYFGHQAYGVEAAARVYFGTHARSLTGWQAALLAGMVQAPSDYDPVTHPALARQRRQQVLDDMLAEGDITATQHMLWSREPLLPAGHKVALPSKSRGIAAYFTQYVESQLVARFGRRGTYGGGLKVYTTFNLHQQQIAKQAVRQVLGHQDWTRRNQWPAGALAAIDPRNGQLKAIVGGSDFSQSQFNLATEARRQPGSSFKPFVLLAALGEGIQPQTHFTSKPQYIQLGSQLWHVTNDTPSYLGSIPLTTATTYSDNTVFAQLTMRVGPGQVRQVAHRMGIETPLDANPAIGLGGLTLGVSPLEMAHAYATLANGGVRVGGSILFRKTAPGLSADPSLDPIAITKIVLPSGKVLINHPVRKQVVPREDALQVISMLKPVIRQGTANLIAGFPRPAAGKTGTTSNFVDAWFAGMTPQLATAVWVGYPNIAHEMRTEFRGKEVFGGTFPALIWSKYEQAALAGQPSLDWPAPISPPSEYVLIDPATGLRTTAGCPRAVSMVYAIALVPSQFSSCTGSVVTTPDLTGVTARQAKHLLLRAGLQPEIKLAVAPAGETSGTVFYQDPGPSQPAQIGHNVLVLVARRVVQVFVPDVLGHPQRAAVSALRTAGFQVRILHTPSVNHQRAGTVIFQRPPGLQRQPRFSPVTIEIATKPTATGG